MGSDGRIEKRAKVKVPVHIVPMEGRLSAETTTTVNISRNGARLLTSRRWRPGEELDIASLSGEFRRQARVIYCSPVNDRQFYLGLEFDSRINAEKDAAWASVA
jgi:hypothetical protein